MQIHELTQTRVDEGLGSMVGGIAGGLSNMANKVVGAVSPVGSAKNAYASAVRPQQIKMLADKVYTGWKQYEKTLLQSNPDAKQTDMYEQSLLAFVVKNLLGGQYLPNVINKDKITALVKQLSKSGTTPTPPPATPPPATPPPAATPPVTKKPVTKKPVTKKPPANTAGAGVFGGIASQLTEKAPNTVVNTPVAPPAKPSVATLNPQQEKDLWLQLTQQAAVATAQAPGTAASSGKSGKSDSSDGPSAGDARTYAQQLAPKDEAVKQALAAFKTASNNNTGGINVKSTGNPVADALLISAGFQGI